MTSESASQTSSAASVLIFAIAASSIILTGILLLTSNAHRSRISPEQVDVTRALFVFHLFSPARAHATCYKNLRFSCAQFYSGNSDENAGGVSARRITLSWEYGIVVITSWTEPDDALCFFKHDNRLFAHCLLQLLSRANKHNWLTESNFKCQSPLSLVLKISDTIMSPIW